MFNHSYTTEAYHNNKYVNPKQKINNITVLNMPQITVSEKKYYINLWTSIGLPIHWILSWIELNFYDAEIYICILL